MIIKRMGNKSKIASDIYKHFPKHKIYIELFFGAGGMFFNKPKATYNYLNDIDNNIITVFDCIEKKQNELIDYIIKMPLHKEFIERIKKQKNETDIVKKTANFLYLSNFTLYSKGNTLKIESTNAKEILIENIKKYQKEISNVLFSNTDFRNVLQMYSFKKDEKKQAFIYADPPYLDTDYRLSYGWTKKSFIDLLDYLQEQNIKYAISEFNNEFVISECNKRNLNLIEIGTRVNIKNRKTEILITNYPIINKLFDN